MQALQDVLLGTNIIVPVTPRTSGFGTSAGSSADLIIGHTGGYLPQLHGGGMPLGTNDEVLASLKRKEFVVNEDSTSKYLPLLRFINADRYHDGGMVGGYDGASAPAPGGGSAAPEHRHVHLHGGTFVGVGGMREVAKLIDQELEAIRRSG